MGTRKLDFLNLGSWRNSLDVLGGDVFNVEADVVAGKSLRHVLLVHLHGLDLGGQVHGGEVDHAAGLQDTGLHTANGHCSDTTDFVDILNRGKLRNVTRKNLKICSVRLSSFNSWNQKLGTRNVY